MKTCIIIGTRPEAIKMSPVVRACERQGDVDWSVSHTGRDCSCDVGRVFSGGLGLPDARYNLDCGSGSEGHWSCQTIVPLAAGCYVDGVIERFRTSCCIR